MRWAVVLTAAMLLVGCQKSFDDRYADARKKISEKAASIDKELAEKASEAAMASDAPPPADLASAQP